MTLQRHHTFDSAHATAGTLLVQQGRANVSSKCEYFDSYAVVRKAALAAAGDPACLGTAVAGNATKNFSRWPSPRPGVAKDVSVVVVLEGGVQFDAGVAAASSTLAGAIVAVHTGTIGVLPLRRPQSHSYGLVADYLALHALRPTSRRVLSAWFDHFVPHVANYGPVPYAAEGHNEAAEFSSAKDDADVFAEEFLSAILSAPRLRDAIDVVFRRVDAALLFGDDVRGVRRSLAGAATNSTISVDVLLSLLTATLPWKRDLPERLDVVRVARARGVAEYGERSAEAMLRGLT